MVFAKRMVVSFFLLSWLSVAVNAAEVVSENLVFLKEDGHNYLLQRTLRTDWTQYNFYLDKAIGPAAIYYIDPPQYSWALDQPDINQLTFESGNFTVMYPGSYGEQVTVDAEGVFTLDTHDGIERDDGHFGSWHSPDNYTRFVQAWVFPEAYKIISYESNREGDWVEQNNTLTYYGEDVNDLTFKVRYQLLDADGDGVADTHDRCLETAASVVVDETGCEADSDQDGVLNRDDRCAATATGVSVDALGCEKDADADGIVDSKDQCPDSVSGADVNRQGCEMDCDGDGVINSQDQCARTPAGAAVNVQGCEVDTDGDGVENSLDECPHTPAATQVNASGCELDSDADGVADSQDNCPGSATGSVVDVSGCELDADADGVIDSADQCADTPANRPVDTRGCETDADADGVTNAADLCPDTAVGIRVDATGCNADKPIELRGVNFHFNSDELTDQSMVILDNVARTLLNHPDLHLQVAGHTDAEGIDDFNLDLSTRRALTVRDYLVAHGVNAEQLTSQGFGEQRPVAANDSAAGRAANRRVELLRMTE